MESSAPPQHLIDPSGHYISPGKVVKQFDVSPQALRKWALRGLIPYISTPGGNYLYEYGALSRLFSNGAQPVFLPEGRVLQKAQFVYARVSSGKQAEDLERQGATLQRLYPRHTLISDIGSGLNWKRKGFRRVMGEVLRGNVSEIVIARRDRLCRFGLELLEFVFKHFGTKLVVLGSEFQSSASDANTEHNVQSELAEDLLAIVNVFVAKTNGMRGQAQARERRAAGLPSKDRGGRPAKRPRPSEEGEGAGADQGYPLSPAAINPPAQQATPMD